MAHMLTGWLVVAALAQAEPSTNPSLVEARRQVDDLEFEAAVKSLEAAADVRKLSAALAG